jgi:mannose-6-phosphate isomerase-like protein (cupin superfamily)
MLKHSLVIIGSLVFAGLVVQAQQAPAGRGAAGRGAAQETVPAPAPGTAGIFKSNEELQAALKKSMAANGDNQSSGPIANTDQYRVNLVHREKPAGALAHAGNTELHYIVEGTGVVVTGGEVVRGTGTNAATIKGGVTHNVKKGDVIIVPAGSGHWYKEVTTPITYLEVRFVAPK